MKTPIERIEQRIERVPFSGCWIYTGAVMPNGYGVVQVGTKAAPKTKLVHRVTYEHHKGAVPVGTDLDHLCRLRSCCNPSHLEPVSRRENLRRGDTNGAKTHCARGHAFTEENTYVPPSHPNERQCRTCKPLWRRAYYEKEGR